MKLSLIDAFTDRPFAGNPAAVCLLDRDPAGSWKQSVARELGLPATAFLRRLEKRVHEIRWFSPLVELNLCGHGTLASAHFLREERRVEAGGAIRFESRSGPLLARTTSESIELDFPAESASSCPAPEGLLDALGIEAKWFGRNRLDFLVEAADASTVRGLAPDFPRLASAGAGGRGVIVTSASDDPRFDFVSRFFAPSVGIDEDAVTGSAHCCLGPFWADRLGKKYLRGFQASARGGTVSVRTGENGRVYLGGAAVTVFRGDLAVPE
jgi:PhzF family phenazine biosynthesis protein